MEDALPYRDFLTDVPGGVWYNYTPQVLPMTIGPVVDRTQPTPVDPATGQWMPPLTWADGSIGSGNNTGMGGISATPSSVTGVGPGSIAANAMSGNAIAALMGIASLAAPAPVSAVMGIGSALNSLLGPGLTQGVAIANQLSTNSVNEDIADVANAIATNEEGTVGIEGGATGAAGATGTGTGTVSGVDGISGGNATGEATANASSPGEGSGETYSVGGRAYRRFQKGGQHWVTRRRPIRNPQRREFPGIWDDPRLIAEEAYENTSPEDPAMRRLFGHDRDMLYERFKDRVGNISGATLIPLKAKPRGSTIAPNIMTEGNAQRLIDILGEGEEYAPEMSKGMHVWYALDPVHERLTALHGPDEADRLFRRFNTLVGMASPQSDVLTEIYRGTAANALANMGRFQDFNMYAGLPADQRARIRNVPKDILGIPGTFAHRTVQAPQMGRFLDTGNVQMTKPKVPLYIGASSIPSLGQQSDWPVPDSHFSRGIGLADVRTDQAYARSMSMPEIATLAPWFREAVAAPFGIEAVPAQARLWGLLGRKTGVDTPVGAPKLELLSRHIMRRAKELGVSPETFRDAVISGDAFARGGRAYSRFR